MEQEKKFLEYALKDGSMLNNANTFTIIDEEFVREYKDVINWNTLSKANFELGNFSNSFFKEFADRINWQFFFYNNNFLDLETIEEVKDNFDTETWNTLSFRSQSAYLTEDFIETNFEKLKPSLINLMHQNSKLTESFIEKHYNDIDPRFLFKNYMPEAGNYYKFSESFLKKHKDDIDPTCFINEVRPTDLELAKALEKGLITDNATFNYENISIDFVDVNVDKFSGPVILWFLSDVQEKNKKFDVENFIRHHQKRLDFNHIARIMYFSEDFYFEFSNKMNSYFINTNDKLDWYHTRDKSDALKLFLMMQEEQ